MPAASKKTIWLGALLSALLTGCVLAAPAGAVLVQKSARNHQRIGVLPRRGVSPGSFPHLVRHRPRTSGGSGSDGSGSSGTLAYNGGPVLHAEQPYLVFWNPAGSPVSSADKLLYERYLADSAHDSGLATNAFAVDRQFTDGSGFAGQSQTWSSAQVIDDTHAYPANGCTSPGGAPACLTDSQLQTELSRLLAANPSLPTGTSGSAPIYFIVTPPGVDSCFDSSASSCASGGQQPFCAYHSSYSAASDTVLYADIPELPAATDPKGCQSDANTAVQSPNANPTADVVIKYLSHEFNETITDPTGMGWFSSAGNENGDECNFSGSFDPANGSNPNAFTPVLGGDAGTGTLFNQLVNGHQYYIQSEWSNGENTCEMQPVAHTLAPTFAAPTKAIPGESVSFNPAGSTASAGFSSTTWNFGDASAPDFSTAAPTTVTHSFSALKSYTVTLTAVDQSGNLATVTHAVNVTHAAAAFTYSPGVGVRGSPVSFDASSSAIQGQTPTYSWNFGDGSQTATGIAPSHSYTSSGAYTVTLTIDNGTYSDSISHVVKVDVPPLAAFSVTTTNLVTGSPVSFDGSASTPAGTLSYAWTFGDGSSGTGQTASHTYGAAGTYAVGLTVTDADGHTNTTTHLVTVDPAPRSSFAVGTANALVNSPVAFDGSGSGGLQPLTYRWQFGDGSTATGAKPRHTYRTPGVFTVVLAITDGKGRTAASSQTVTVSRGVPASAIAVRPSRSVVGRVVAFSSAGSSDSGSSLVSYRWSFGDGGVAAGTSAAHVFSRPGAYTATLTVVDGTGAMSTTSHTVTVLSPSITGVKVKTGPQAEQLTVTVNGAGTVSLGKAKYRAVRAGRLIMKLKLSAGQRHRLVSAHKLKVGLTLKFLPTVGRASSRRVKFTVHG